MTARDARRRAAQLAAEVLYDTPEHTLRRWRGQLSPADQRRCDCAWAALVEELRRRGRTLTPEPTP